MIINFLKLFTEYVSIVLCTHKAVGKKIKLNWLSLFDIAFYMMLIYILEGTSFGNLILYVYWFVYIKTRVIKSWKQTVKSFCIMLCTIPIFQLLLYAMISFGLPNTFDIQLVGIAVNILIIIAFSLWKEKYLYFLMDKITKYKKLIFFLLLIFLFKALISYYTEYKVINAYSMRQIIICFLLVALMLILWINSENEKKHKAEELRTYQLYTKTFEDAVAAIRMKQHEFDNHINAIKCMRYSIHDREELIEEQDKYCDRILRENKFNKLLKLNMSPILIGYLYSKFTAATARGVNIDYEIQDMNIEGIAINDLIEIIGILFDNAVEALEEQGDKEMQIKLLQTDKMYTFSVANISGWKTNNEIEKFFEYGYSTKGKEHGVGLYRVNTLLKKYKANIQVENITQNDMNYLCFKVMFLK